jgi:hypothetical protein
MSERQFDNFLKRYRGVWRRVMLVLGGLWGTALLALLIVEPEWPYEMWEYTSPTYNYVVPWDLQRSEPYGHFAAMYRDMCAQGECPGSRWLEEISLKCGMRPSAEVWCALRGLDASQIAAANRATRQANIASLIERAWVAILLSWPLWLFLFPGLVNRAILPLFRWIAHGSEANKRRNDNS